MNPDEFWERFYDKLYVNNGRVNIRLKNGKILYNISDADDYSENVYFRSFLSHTPFYH